MAGKVAILPWGDIIEDFLDPLNTDVEDFATNMSGGWMFGYADSLRRAGIDCCVIAFSREKRSADT